MVTQNFENHDRDRVLDATDIVGLIGDHVALKPKGREFVGLCPFHDDRNPSMYVVPGKQIFHCFVCGAGGNAITFIMKHLGLSFPEALRYLADRAGIELAPQTRVQRKDGAERERATRAGKEEIARANVFAQEFFRAILQHKEHGAAARGVVERRGISAEMVELFGIGAAPERWDGLVQTAAKRGMPFGSLEEAGLIRQKRDGDGHIDVLRHRLIFPIHDASGRVIAFGGRRLNDEDEPKYLNSPETSLFNKSETLYGLRQATTAIRTQRRAIIVEGYTDVVACHQAGVCNAVATLGTALTELHARVLKRLCDEVVLIFDGDDAGQRAAERAFEIFFLEPVDVRVAVLPGGADPDDLLKREGGRELFEEVVGQARDVLAFRFDRLEAEMSGAGSGGRVRRLEELALRMVELGWDRLTPARRSALVRRLTRLSGVDERAVLETVREARMRVSRRVRESGDVGVSGRGGMQPQSAREHVLACVLAEGSLVADFGEEIGDILDPDAYGSPLVARVAGRVLELVRAGSEMSLRQVLSGLDDDAEACACATSFAQGVLHAAEGDRARVRAHLLGSVHRYQLASSRGVGTEHPSGSADRLSEVIARRRLLGGDPTAAPRVGFEA